MPQACAGTKHGFGTEDRQVVPVQDLLGIEGRAGGIINTETDGAIECSHESAKLTDPLSQGR
jgi:hypothetical protein